MAKATGYSIYNPEVQRRSKKSRLENLYPPLPSAHFDIIYVDPPWHYNGKLQYDRSSVGVEDLDTDKNIFISAASFKYPTLKLDELECLQAGQIAKDDCLLFMWTTNPHLDQCVQLGKAWGFEYKTVAFVWNKQVHNPGHYTLSYCELVLLFKRGKIPGPRGARNVKQLVNCRRGKHSEKPEEVRRRIEQMFPTQRRIELFARREDPGWTAWGLDVFRNKDSVNGIASSRDPENEDRNGQSKEPDLWDLAT